MKQNFTVVIPLYNKSSFIIRAINSVLNQSYKNFELIIIDDGSTDDSLDVIRKYFGDKPLFKLLTQRNSGVANARNRGLNESKNKYICFLDADDEWSECYLKNINELIANVPGRSLYSCRHKVVSEEGRAFERKKILTDTQNWGELRYFYKEYTNESLVNSSTACCLRNDLLSIGGFPVGVKRGEDIWTWLRLAAIGGVAYTDSIGATIYRDATERSSFKSGIDIPIHIKMLDEGLSEIPEASKYEVKEFIINNAFMQAVGACMEGNWRAILIIAKILYPYSKLIFLKTLLLIITPPQLLLYLKKKINE